MPEGIDDPADAPAMFVPHRPHERGSRGNRFGEGGIRVVHDHHHPDGTAGQRLRTEVLILGRLVGYPKLGSIG